MSETKNISSTKKRRLIWPWVTLITLILLFFAIRISLKSEYLNNYVKQQVIEQVSNLLNGSLSIQTMSGDLLSDLTLYGIQVHDVDGDLVIAVDSVFTSFNVWALLRGEIQVNEMFVYQPFVNAIENDENTWNLSNLWIESEDDSPFERIFVLDSLRIVGGIIEIESGKIPDSTLVVKGLKVGAGFRIAPEEYSLRLHEFEMTVTESRLSEDINIDAGATIEDGVFTLDQLTLNTGATLFEAYMQYAESNGDIEIDAILKPLSWRDVLAYSDEPILLQDVRLSADVGGNLSAFRLNLEMEALGLENLRLALEGGYEEELTFTSLEIQSGKLNLPVLTGDTTQPVIGSVEFSLTGQIVINSYDSASLTGSFNLSHIEYVGYELEYLNSEFSLSDARVKINLLTQLHQEQLNHEILAIDVFSTPVWTLNTSTNGINPAIWLKNDELEGFLTFTLEAKGIGFQPGSELWSAYATFTESEIFGQTFRNLELDVELTDRIIDGKMMVNLNENPINAEIAVNNWMEVLPQYTFELFTNSFNLEDVNTFENFPTSINFIATGRGSGFDINTMTLEGNIVIEESQINGAELDRFQSMIYLNNQVINLTETLLRSTFAEGNLLVRQHLFNLDDPLNRVDFDLELLDLQPLAGLAGAEILAASGTASGTIRTSRGSPEIQLIGSFYNIQLDSIQVGTAEIKGGVLGFERSTFELDTRINDLYLGTYFLDDIWLRSAGEQNNGIISGNYRLDMELDQQIDLTMQSHYQIISDSLNLNTSYLRIADGPNQYNLARDFNLTYSSGLVAITPLVLRGSSGVELALKFDQYKPMAFRGSFNATEIDLEMMQKLAMDEVIIQGKMSGDLTFDMDIEDEIYNLESDITLSELNHSGFAVDIVQFNAVVRQDRLNATLQMVRNDEEFFTFQADVPFKPGDPLEFEDEFFQQPVEGNFNLSPLNLSNEQEFLRAIGFENTSGLIQASGQLGGVAGNPELSGDLFIDNGNFSGVPVDSVRFNWNYDHSDERISIIATIVSSGQKVAEASGFYPLLIDWKTFNVIAPDDQSGISLSVVTNELDLAAFNQFLDQTNTRQLRGRLGAELIIRGEIYSPEIKGFLRLRQGGINLVPNNINLRAIEANIEFAENTISVKNITAQSLGTLSANGEIKIDGYDIGQANLSLNARNFQIINTRDAQAILSLNTLIDGNLNNPKLTGLLSLDRGFLYLDNFGDRTVEEVILEEDEASLLDGLAFWNNLTMEMKVTTDRNFWVRNRARPEIQLELNGELDLVKSKNQEIEVFGQMGVIDGYVTQLGKRFTFDQGDLVFSGNPANPALGIRTLYTLRQPSDIKIWYIIGGTADNPTFTYESDPEMELQDIVSYTVFGRPFHALMAWEQTVAGRSDAAVADAAIDILLDRVEQLATERLGIDLLQIDNTRTGGNTGTTVKAGKFISDKLFVAFLQEFGSYMNSQIIVEYQLRRDLNLILTGSDSYHTGIDVLWKYDY